MSKKASGAFNRKKAKARQQEAEKSSSLMSSWLQNIQEKGTVNKNLLLFVENNIYIKERHNSCLKTKLFCFLFLLSNRLSVVLNVLFFFVSIQTLNGRKADAN